MGDALFCQRDLCQQILDSGGHYFVAVKDNQPQLLREMSLELTAPAAVFSPLHAAADGPRERDQASSVDKAHGRIERRTLTSTTVLNHYLDWPGVQQISEIQRTRKIGTRPRSETAYYITSAPRRLARADVLLDWASRTLGRRSRTDCTTSATKHSARTAARSRPATRCRTWPRSATRP